MAIRRLLEETAMFAPAAAPAVELTTFDCSFVYRRYCRQCSPLALRPYIKYMSSAHAFHWFTAANTTMQARIGLDSGRMIR